MVNKQEGEFHLPRENGDSQPYNDTIISRIVHTKNWRMRPVDISWGVRPPYEGFLFYVARKRQEAEKDFFVNFGILPQKEYDAQPVSLLELFTAFEKNIDGFPKPLALVAQGN